VTDKSDELIKAYNAFEAGRYGLARELFERIVQQENRVHLYLGWMYDQGLGVTENSKQAEHHYRCLSEGNDVDGKYYLASLLQKKGDLASAVALYEEAADLNQVSAAYWAYALRNGDSASLVDRDKADFYLRKAAKLGHLFAKRDLAIQEMRNCKGVSKRVISRIRCFLLKIKGLFLIMKNRQDMRVR
jgi:TPR repeat protein